jgi:hypothetical protein
MDKWLKSKNIEEDENSNNNKRERNEKNQIKQPFTSEIPVPTAIKAKVLLPGSTHLMFPQKKIETKGFSRNGILNGSTSASHNSSAISAVRAGTVVASKVQDESRLRKKSKVNNDEKNHFLFGRDDMDCNDNVLASKVISRASIIKSDRDKELDPTSGPSCTFKPDLMSSVIETNAIANGATETITKTITATTTTTLPPPPPTATKSPLRPMATNTLITSNRTTALSAATIMTSISASSSGKLISSIDTIKTAEQQIDVLNATATTTSLLSASGISTSTTPSKLPTTKSIDSGRSSKDIESQRKVGKQSNLANLNDLFVSVLPSFQMQEKDKLKKKLTENIVSQTQGVCFHVNMYVFIFIYVI